MNTDGCRETPIHTSEPAASVVTISALRRLDVCSDKTMKTDIWPPINSD